MNNSRIISLLIKIAAVLIVTSIAWMLRERAVNKLSVDYDEDDYMRAAQEFTQRIRARDWAGFQEVNYRTEHPPLSKIMYGFSLLSVPEEPLIPDRPTSAEPDKSLPRELLLNARSVGQLLGTLTVFLLAFLNPFAGLFLATHAFTIKYVSQVMLESLPALTSLAAVMAYVQSKKQKNGIAWLIVSAIFLGLTAASKYLYCLVGIAILVDWFLHSRENNSLRLFFRNMLIWGGLAVLIFFLADPYLWPDPVVRLKESVFYHAGYASGASEVQNAGYPAWQPFVWLNTSPLYWDPGAFVFAPDLLISILAAFGVTRLWRKERTYALWLGIAVLFLLLWPTKWPQYILVLTVPLSLAAAEAVGLGWEKAWDALRNRRLGKDARVSFNRREVLRSMPWLVPGLVIFAVFTLFPLIFQIAISLTDFNSISIRDGLNGGVWREVWEGLTGQTEVVNPEFPFRSKEVQFTGPSSYLPVFDWITGDGILVFNTLWTVISVTLQTVLGVGAALLLWNKRIRFRRGWQTLFILPWAIPEMIGSLMWLTIFMPFGWMYLALQDFGRNIPLAFFDGWERNPNITMIVLLIAGLWYGFPFMMLAATAGLKQVPMDVFDAAAIDGANGWQTFRHVTWPLLMPLVVPAIIIRGIFAFNQFYLIQLFGIYHSSYFMTTLATLSYNIFNPSGFSGFNGQFALSAAINIITMLILIGFVVLFNRWSKADEGVTYA